ncbi:MAG: hypothetical protein IKL77_06425 [Clostridia bacterium]|nr:hypothetical protein [Clostridia bacterium]
MHWVLDILIVVILAAALFLGYKKGLLGMATGVLAVILMLALTLVGIAGFLLLFYKLGVIDNLAYLLVQGPIGETNLIFEKLQFTSYDVCQILAAVILAFISFILSYFLVIYLFKGIKALMDNIERQGVFEVVDGTLGLVVNAVIVLGITWAVLGLVYAISYNGDGVFIGGIDRVFRAGTITRWFYEINPLNDLFISLFA